MKTTASCRAMLCIIAAAFIAGCSGSTDPDDSSQAPAPPGFINITVDSDSTSATVSWTASPDNDITGYRVVWKGLTQNDSASTDVGKLALSAEITGLMGGQDYSISVRSMRGQVLSSPLSAVLSLGSASAPAPPSGLVVTPINQTTIAAKWDPSPTPSVTGYRVTYRQQSSGDNGSLTTTTNTATITNLQAGEPYAISVQAMRGASVSDTVTTWSATAMRYDTEPDGVTPIRMYEIASLNGAVMILDPSKGGPKNESARTTHPSAVQLAIYVDDTQGTFDIGPAYAFPEFPQVDEFDPNVYISDSTFVATVATMNDWYYGTSIEGKILTDDGNLRAYRLYQRVVNANGHGFFVRTGTAGNYHYARVFVKNNGGKLLQGTSPNRYVELEISY